MEEDTTTFLFKVKAGVIGFLLLMGVILMFTWECAPDSSSYNSRVQIDEPGPGVRGEYAIRLNDGTLIHEDHIEAYACLQVIRKACLFVVLPVSIAMLFIISIMLLNGFSLQMENRHHEFFALYRSGLDYFYWLILVPNITMYALHLMYGGL